ncbi:histidine--tRNA ligase [Allofustis seminis]|uniref:histidine--tRNA ligase n=1 Tax=Allofustis seminis TaxID=166939 RepID=UPI0003800703|nr:histidine--tRNA ligase [Allofustis seminis]
MKYQKIRGTADILPNEGEKWSLIENKLKEILMHYYYQEARLPIFEQFELFARGVGETSDIVSKEMYDFYDKGERHLALRPEGTAGMVRAYVENKLYGPEHHKPQKYFYIGPMFRFERPQNGRMRQFHQLGVEVFGSKNAAVDAEVMTLAYVMCQSLGLKDLKLYINSLGSNEDRIQYRQALIDFLTPHFAELSKDSQERLHKNPLRVLDSKDPQDQKIVAAAPNILDYLSEESAQHFGQVQEILQALNIPYEIVPSMVRGLDYYNDTIFELVTTCDILGAGSTICGGGRYDQLVEEVGGPETPAFGFAMGLERLMILLDEADDYFANLHKLDAYVITIGQAVNAEAAKVTKALRDSGWKVEREFIGRKPGSQFKSADKLNASYVFTMGENELETGIVNMKHLETGHEVPVKLEDIYNFKLNLN